MSAAAYSKVNRSEIPPQDSLDIQPKDLIGKELETYRELLKKKERILGILEPYSGEPRDVLEEAVTLPDILYRSMEHLCHGRLGDAKKTMKTYVGEVSREITHMIYNPEHQILAYKLAIISVDLASYDKRFAIAARLIKPYLEKGLTKEKGRLKAKLKAEEKLEETIEKLKELEKIVDGNEM